MTQRNDRQSVAVSPTAIGPGRVTLTRLDGTWGAAAVIVDTVQQVDLVPGRYRLNFHPFSYADGETLEHEVTVTSDTTRLDLDEIAQAQFVPKPRITRFIRPSYQFDHDGLEALMLPMSTVGGDFGFAAASRTGRQFELEWSAMPGEALSGEKPRLGVVLDGSAPHELTIRVDGADAESSFPATGIARLRVADRLPLLVITPVFAGGTQVSIARRGTDPIIEVRPNDPALRSAIAALSEADQDEAIPVLDWLVRQTDGAPSVFWDKVVTALLEIHCHKQVQEASHAFYWQQDAAIIKAWAKAADADEPTDELEQYILSALVKSHDTGGPIFSYSYTLALALLEALRGTAQNPTVRERAATEMAHWTARGDHRMLEGPFTIYEDDGTLDRPYAEIASWQSLATGTVADDGFRLDPPKLRHEARRDDLEALSGFSDPPDEIAALAAEIVGTSLTPTDFGQIARDPGLEQTKGAQIVELAQLGWVIYDYLRSLDPTGPTIAEFEAAMDEQVGARAEGMENIYKAVIKTTIHVGKMRREQ